MQTDLVRNATQLKQSPVWSRYLKTWGWQTIKIKEDQVYLRKSSIGTVANCFYPKHLSIEDLEDVMLSQKKPFQTILFPHHSNFTPKEYSSHKFYQFYPEYEFTATSLVDISQSEDDIIKSFSKTARNILAHKQPNIYVDTSSGSQESLDEFYTLYSSTFQKKHFVHHNYAECKKILQSSTDESFFVTAYQNSIPIASAWFLVLDKTLNYFKIGMSEQAYQTNCNYHVLYEAIKIGKQKKCEIFDLNFIYDKRYPKKQTSTQGFSNFKAHFHGVELYYPPPFIKFYNPIIRGVQKCFRFFS